MSKIEFEERDGTRTKGKIIGSQKADPGWKACYVLDYGTEEDDDIKLLSRHIILWVTIEYEDGEHEIRHFVADWDGEITDFLNIEHEFLCVVAPDQDFEAIARQALKEHLYSKLEKQTDSHITLS